ncbi:hypothetical protein [Methanobrevibacter curvatus]|nr:hypothetical protein [Methanobrevibacter curvatus]
MRDNFLSDFSVKVENLAKNKDKQPFKEIKNNNDKKKAVLKFLSQIGVDTRFISYFNDKIFINNLRFSKFSRKKEEIFNHRYPKIFVIRSSLFQKIASKSSKSLSSVIKVKDNILIHWNIENELCKAILFYKTILSYILLEPYTRKYGIKIITNVDLNNKKESNFKTLCVMDLNNQVEKEIEDIFKGKGIISKINEKNEIYPLKFIDKRLIEDFVDEFVDEKLLRYFINKFNKNYINININNNQNFNELEHNKGNINKKCKGEEIKNISKNFMEFLEEINPQFKENILKSVEYLSKNN